LRGVIRLAVIVAAAENGVIGQNNAMPWYLPEDMRYFKQVTMGKPIIMGRKTFESIGKPLPGRANIVITRNHGFQAEGIEVVSSLDEALELGGQLAQKAGVSEMVVIGGAEIYRAAIPQADCLYFTEVHAPVEGDALLPQIDWSQWRETQREYHGAEPPGSDLAYSFVCYERTGAQE
jgi:dihydrofolate reductase